jgi:hypothetical protein
MYHDIPDLLVMNPDRGQVLGNGFDDAELLYELGMCDTNTGQIVILWK